LQTLEHAVSNVPPVMKMNNDACETAVTDVNTVQSGAMRRTPPQSAAMSGVPTSPITN
jgi:hypothetical protein